MNLAEDAYAMTTNELLREAGQQFAAGALYERGGWFALLVRAAKLDALGVQPSQVQSIEGADYKCRRHPFSGVNKAVNIYGTVHEWCASCGKLLRTY